MPSFLELVPQWDTATVTIETHDGAATFEVRGIPITQLADICKRFPAFGRVVEGGAGLLSASEAMPAIVAAGLGHCGDTAYEAQAASLPSGTTVWIAGEIMRLSFPSAAPPAAVPLANGADVEADGAASAPAVRTVVLPPPSNN